MRKAPSVRCLCAVLVAICGLTLSAASSVHAGKGKPNVVRSSGQHVKGGRASNVRHHRHSRRGDFRQKRFHKQGDHSGFVKRRDRKRRHFYAPAYYYGYDSGYRYGDYPRPEPSYRAEPSDVGQQYQDRPVTPKWVHVSGIDDGLDPSSPDGPSADGRLHRNCLSVKTQITVEGNPVDAFGEACLLPDGTWQLNPSKPND